MAAPVIVDGRTIAVCAISSLNFFSVTEYNYALFNLIVEWVERTMHRVASITAIAPGIDTGCTGGFCAGPVWEVRLRQERRRQERYGQPYSIMGATLVADIAAELVPQVAALLRGIDAITYDPTGEKVKILLPLTNQKEAVIVARRIQERTGVTLVTEDT